MPAFGWSIPGFVPDLKEVRNMILYQVHVRTIQSDTVILTFF